MVKVKVARKEFKFPKWFWGTVVAILIFIAIVIGGLLYHQTGWPAYMEAVSICGGKAPIEAKSLINKPSVQSSSSESVPFYYIMPNDDSYRIPAEKEYRTYFCSEAEAISSGYKHVKSS